MFLGFLAKLPFDNPFILCLSIDSDTMEELDNDIYSMLEGKAKEIYRDLQYAVVYQQSANRMVMGRLGYNDHGPTHAKIVTKNALVIFDILKHFVPLNVVEDMIGTEEDSKVVVVTASFLHDIGNMVHRDYHNVHSVTLASPILHDIIPKYYDNPVPIISEILHAIFAHDEEEKCYTTEAGIVSIADGTDMEEGRGRIPFNRGRMDIHCASALAINSVRLNKGKKGLVVTVSMKDNAGIFQIQEVLGKKLKTTGLEKYVEIFYEKEGQKKRIDI